MKCVMCDNPKSLKAKHETVKYKDCGLDYVTIHNVEVHHCDKCGEDYYSFGNAEKLHAIIAQYLVRKKGLLTGRELRFLRTYLGYSTKVFAKLTRYTDATVSRFENAKQPVSPQFDVLTRSLVAHRFPDRNYDLHELWLNDEGESFKRLELAAQKGGWVIKKAA